LRLDNNSSDSAGEDVHNSYDAIDFEKKGGAKINCIIFLPPCFSSLVLKPLKLVFFYFFWLELLYARLLSF
jgi:hypothetical protein